MSEETRNNARRHAVSSVGNAWILSHSKSHPGHVYYFNTATGEAVWNLRSAELEKAALTRQVGETGSKPLPCREPKDNPPPQKIPNQQIINNSRFNQQQHSTLKIFEQQHQAEVMFRQNPEISLIQNHQQSASGYPNIPMNNVNPFDFNALSNQINAYNVITTPNVYNTDRWAIPRAQQIIITPTIPLMNQAQTNSSLNIPFNQVIHNDQGNSSRFKRFQITPNRQQRFQPRNHVGRGGPRNFKQTLSSLNSNDLRQQLYLKRRINNIAAQRNSAFTGDECGPILMRNEGTADVSSHVADLIECELISHKNTEINDAHVSIDKVSSKLDVTPLKSLAPSAGNSEPWYIVVDLRVLLDEFKLLTTILDADEYCYFVVPESVMSELKNFIARSNNIPARRIFHSLTQLIDNDCAFVAGECLQEYGDTITNPILKTCWRLFEENFHVILVAEDNELLSCKKFIRINIFSGNELKSLVEWDPFKYLEKVTPVARPAHIPAPHKCLFKVIPSRSKTPVNEPLAGDNTFAKKPTVKETSVTIGSSFKDTVDAEIQTDTVTVISNDTNTDTVDSQQQNIPESADGNATTESFNHPRITTVIQTKRRDIKLKRSVSNQAQSTSMAKGNEKKPFRWRRNRNASLPATVTCNNDKPCTVTQSGASVQTDTASDYTDKQSEHIPNADNENEQKSSEFIRSRSPSVIAVPDANRENFNIDETSTSGIISNTESNADAVIEFDTHEENQHEESEDILPSIICYNIDSESMEESLRTKCEEWVSRFIQIMEEVLAVILHKESTFSKVDFPPPWTLHEAAVCIGRHSDNARVKFITDKMCCILFGVSDGGSGKINTAMSPSQFMEMYSCGVCLLHVIKAVTTCEDIEIAEESLRNLLADIKNPCCDLNDSFIDPHEDCANMQETILDITSEKTDNETPSKHSNSSKYNLRSARLKKGLQKSSEPVSNLDTKSTFFSNLSLMKVSSPKTSETNASCASQTGERAKITYFSSGNDEEEPVSDNKLSSISVVRKFNKCAKFEEMLKSKVNTNTYEADDEYVDDEDNYDFPAVEYRSDDLNMSNEGVREVPSEPNDTQTLENSDKPDRPASPEAVDPSVAKISNDTFKLMMCVFLSEIGEAMKIVKDLCDKCHAELRRPRLPAKKRNELRKKVENAHLNIEGIHQSLERMLSGDPNAPSDNIATALKNAGINISDIDKNLILEYRCSIANCKKYVDIFFNTIKDLMTALNSK